MTEQRPNPDQLLARVQAEERKAARGRLKVFFGACAGVGKTYTMLEAARRQAAAGTDVVVGYVEPHARPETMALLEGLEALPVRRVEHRGARLAEFDLDAALARRPGLVLVDELAHTNAPGSRHAKRWQDVMELLEAGIDVYSTLNVQHIETLNDLVAQFSGVRVRETVPDTLFDQADEVELVDLPPDDLLQRLAEGKVYLPDRAEAALRNFFQKSNLVALRELALRRTAERVNIQAESYRHDGASVATAERLLVCVGPSPFSARLVRSTARLALSLRCPWLAVSVERPGSPMSQETQDRVWANLRMAGVLGAETVTLAGTNIAEEIVAYARARHVTKIIVGKPLRARWRDRLRPSLVHDLVRRCDQADLYVISGDDAPTATRATGAAGASGPRRPVAWADYLLAALAVAACTALGNLLAGPDTANASMVYLLGVIAVALRGHPGPAVFASILSATSLNFFLIPPLYTLELADPRYWVTVAVLATTGLVISLLVVRIRVQADAARQREARATTLYSLSRDLGSAETLSRAADLAQDEAGKALDSHVVLLVPDPAGRLSPAAPAQQTSPVPFAPQPQAQDLAVADWVREHAQPAGRGSDTLPSCPWLFVPLAVSGRAVGVLGLHPRGGKPLSPEQSQFLTALAAMLAATIRRIQLAQDSPTK